MSLTMSFLRAGRRSLTARPLLRARAPLSFCGGVGPQSRSIGNIIDAHSHVWTPDTKRFPLHESCTDADLNPRSFTPEELLAEAGPCGVGRVVLIQHDIYHGFDNSYLLDAFKQHPGKFAIVALIDDRDTSTPPAELMRSLLTQGVSGFRIDPFKNGKEFFSPEGRQTDWLEGEGMASMWECAAKTRQAMCFLVDPMDLPDVDVMCERYPDTPCVIDHFARIGVPMATGRNDEEDLAALCVLAKHPQLSVKLSAFYGLGERKPPYADLGPRIQQLLKAFGSARLMWGTDCPYQLTGFEKAAGLPLPEDYPEYTYESCVALIKNPEVLTFLTAEDRENILWKTAERTFFAPLTHAATS